MIMLVYANFNDEVYCQKFLSEDDMSDFINENDVIVIGSKILN